MSKIIAVASGKGGVGKSTLAVALSIALADPKVSGCPEGLKVSLLDADFYGPSIPTLMGCSLPCDVNYDETTARILPFLKYGVSFFSIAFLLRNKDDPVIWRGPMLGKAIDDLFSKVLWGDSDICIVDLPPGTGDVQLSLAQQVHLDGVILVTTPQEVALSDVRRAVNMFRKVGVPLCGVIENMSAFVTPSGESYDIFGSSGVKMTGTGRRNKSYQFSHRSSIKQSKTTKAST